MQKIARLLLLSSLVAQPTAQEPAQPQAKKAPEFHLVAGEYPIAELLQHVEQAIRAPIRAAAAGDLATIAPIRLQCDLALPQQTWEDVLGALLSTRGLVVVRNAEQKGHEVLPSPRGPAGWVKERAQQWSVQDLFERPAFAGPVRVVVQSTTAAPILINQLRPTFSADKGGNSFELVEGGVQLIGLANSVRFALSTIASVAPDVAKTLPATATPPWPRAASATAYRLEPGAYTVTQIVDRLAKALGRNIVVAPATADAAPITVAAAIQGDDLRFEEQLTALLWPRQVLVLQVSGPNGLYEAVRAGPGSWPPLPRAQEFSAAELLARPSLVAWVAAVPVPDGLTQQTMIGVGRAAMRTGASLMMASTSADGLRLTGLSTDVTAMLQALEQKKAGK